MATKKIVWYEGAIYHITNRGNHRNDIFRDEEDFQVYLTFIEENLIYFSSSNYKLITYCLMDNHVHLMIQANLEPLGKFMGRLNSRYTRWFNKKYNYIGHLFQDKYFSELIEQTNQLLDTSRYIHLNPVKAKMVDWPEEYKWSSYKVFIGKNKSKLIDENIVLRQFKYNNRFELYKTFVEYKLILLKEEMEREDRNKETNVI